MVFYRSVKKIRAIPFYPNESLPLKSTDNALRIDRETSFPCKPKCRNVIKLVSMAEARNSRRQFNQYFKS